MLAAQENARVKKEEKVLKTIYRKRPKTHKEKVKPRGINISLIKDSPNYTPRRK
jgi:hypothetical protein